ncbi:hypothetical protein [Clostridium magnum]|uniref:Uncharacterized protein n=1 Tax=Clostridium magnum DSM 2767 TaxID=1121326 RepID=A0A161WU74_9CLOT|nr:hypothetical protein [Clostridium magnum]KZL90418.1 hypothetical protein CLMAG_41890 [Clostridium magnum DSM 2767]SHH84652.1 hypothetical protein SAMN02745944_01566 [Clostridium magnum DSM 2767]
MKMKLWLRYFVYMFLIFVVVFSGEHVFQGIAKIRENSFNPQYFYTSAMTIIFYGSVGLILGLEHFICEIKKEGTWALILPKIVLMGLPSLYFSLAYVTFSFNIEFLRNIIIYPIITLMVSYSGFLSVFPLILGYTIITSFYKHNEKLGV